jgi:hypothetical protein
MNNQKYVREKLQSQGWLDTQVSQVIDNLSEYDIIQIRNSIAHNLPPNIKTKGSKSIKELEAELFKGWELKKDADAKAATELIELPISDGQHFLFSGSCNLHTTIQISAELKSEPERLHELYERIFKTYPERRDSYLYELREIYDAYPVRITGEEFDAINAHLEFQEYLKTILAKIQVEISSLLKAITQLIQIDKRTSFRNMLQFLFKNLDDAHSYVNNSLNDLIYYLDITRHETRNYTRIN